MAHEELHRSTAVDGSSDRSFGLVFAALFIIIAFWPLFFNGSLRWWSLIVAAIFALIALIAPTFLSIPNRLWTRFGVLLGKVISPIAIGILLFGVFTPIGILMRMVGKDPLRLKLDTTASTYWIERTPPGPPPDSMTNQF